MGQKEAHQAMSFFIKNVEVGGGKPFYILGPCSLEGEEFAHSMARSIKEICTRLGVPFIFKASYDKANRTSVKSYRGVGMQEGCRILSDIARELDVPVVTDVHTEEQAEYAAQYVDLLQVPAFLSRQSDLLEACAKTGRPVNVKKGQFLAPWDCKNICEKMLAFGCERFMLCERGTSFGYNNLVVDMRGLAWMLEFGVPLVFDATHSVQRPGGLGGTTGGDRELAPVLANAAMAVGLDGVFMEVHSDPDNALSDGPNQIRLSDLEKVLRHLQIVRAAWDQIQMDA